MRLAVALLLALACGRTAGNAPTPPPPTRPAIQPPTLLPTVTSPPPTDTAAPATEAAPTATLTPDMTATTAAIATIAAAAEVTGIDAELQKYGLSTSQGHLGWLHDPLTLTVNSYMESKPRVNYPDLSVADFVVQADITWQTSTGAAGCGLAFRVQTDLEMGAQYRLNLARFALRPVWSMGFWDGGEFRESISGGPQDTPWLNDEQGSTNQITLIAQGDTFTAYANGQLLGEVTDSRLSQGKVAFVAWQESGETTCAFANAWLWVLP